MVIGEAWWAQETTFSVSVSSSLASWVAYIFHLQEQDLLLDTGVGWQIISKLEEQHQPGDM